MVEIEMRYNMHLITSTDGLTSPAVPNWLNYLQVLSIHEEKYRLIGVVHNHPSLVLTAHSMQELLFIVAMMKLKLGLKTINI